MVPSRIYVVDEMPLNANGKVDRLALKARLESDAGNA
jgi:acyl-coenzyme A synthetase/AMP-(fatty) acid ligase